MIKEKRKEKIHPTNKLTININSLIKNNYFVKLTIL